MPRELFTSENGSKKKELDKHKIPKEWSKKTKLPISHNIYPIYIRENK